MAKKRKYYNPFDNTQDMFGKDRNNLEWEEFDKKEEEPPRRKYYATNNTNTVIVHNHQQSIPQPRRQVQPVYDPYAAQRNDDMIRAQANRNYKIRIEFLKIFKSIITLKSLIVITILSGVLSFLLPETKSTNIFTIFIGAFFMILLIIALYSYSIAGYRVITKGN